MDPEQRSAMFEAPDSTGEQPPKKGPGMGLILGLVGGGLVLLIAIGVGVAFALGSFATQRQSSIPQLLAGDTLVYGTITPALSDLPNIARLQAAYPELFVEQDPSAANEGLAELGMSFEEDIQPWLGAEVAFSLGGISDYDAFFEAVESESYEAFAAAADFTMIAASTDDAAAQAFVQQLTTSATDDGATVQENVYNEVTIYEVSDPDLTLALAVAQGYVITADSVTTIQSIIDRDAAGAETLEASERFQRLRSNLPEGSIGYIYIDSRIVTEPVMQNMDAGLAELPPESADRLREQLANLEALQAVGLSIGIEGEGVRFDTTTTVNLDQFNAEGQQLLEAASVGVDASRMESISSDALAFYTFRFPDTFKDQFMAGFNETPDAAQTLTMMEQQLGVELERDLLSWLVGDTALVALPGEQLGDITLPATGYLAIASEDMAAAETGLGNIAGALELFVGIPLQEETMGGATWNVFQEPSSGQILAGYALLEDDVVIAFGETAMTSASTGGDTAITEAAPFSTVRDNLYTPNAGLIYVNVQDMLATLEAAGEGVDSPEARENLEPIQAVGASSEPGFGEDGVNHTRLFVYISGE